MAKVSVITVNYNTSKDTLRFVDSIIAKTTDISYEIIIVDNASEKEQYQLLQENIKFSENIKLIRSVINLGFGGGNMLGVQHATGDYYAFINNDTELLDNCLLELYKFVNETPNVGFVGPKMLDKDKKFMQRFYNYHTLFVQCFGVKAYEKFYNKPNPQKEYEKPIKVDWVSGAFMFFKKEVFSKIGGFDTHLFLFYEEMDLALKVKKLDLDVYYYPYCSYVHYAGVSTTKQDSSQLTKLRELQISYEYIHRKHYGWFLHQLMRWVKGIKLYFKAFFRPVKWHLFLLHVKGSPLSESLGTNQQIK